MKPSKSTQPTDAETLRALQFALAPLDRAMRDADVETWPRQLMHRTVATRPPWSQWDEAAEHEADLRYESRMADESEYGPADRRTDYNRSQFGEPR